MSLKEYQGKRNFRRTSEPAAGTRNGKGGGTAPRFVIQKHDASHLHYDFRLAMGGVLKSWAVPKGFPLQRGERRLAVEVEDHPLKYAGFEGTIAPGNYGAGTVMVWDQGTYQVAGDDPLRALKSGKLHFTLVGKKLKGDWTLVRMRKGENDSRNQWLLFKSGASHPPISARMEDRSALTRRSLKQIASAGGPEWKSNRQTRVKLPLVKKIGGPPAGTRKLPRAKAAFIDPMKCELVEQLPKGREWIYEIKFDGVRALAIKGGRKLSLISRNAKDVTEKYAPVTAALRDLSCQQAVIDGEVVAVDSEGKSSFQLLQEHRAPDREPPPILYYAFDLLNLNGRDLMGLPLTERKKMLEELVAPIPEVIRFSAGIEADSGRLLKAMKARGLEGVVAKRRDSKYQPGRRSGAWVKFKWSLEQEFVIGGYTPPKGTRAHFGAIFVGYYSGSRLLFASKVGSGYDHAILESLHKQFKPLKQSECPFGDLPSKQKQQGRQGVTAAEMRRCTWLKPRLVAQIRFAEWTRDGHLRQPVFLGLREDKDPKEVVRELPK